MLITWPKPWNLGWIFARLSLEHHFLDLAKARRWLELRELLARRPELARAQPGGRWSALHQAASAGAWAVAVGCRWVAR